MAIYDTRHTTFGVYQGSSGHTSVPHLPLELVLNITTTIPASPDQLLNAAHPTTKLLLTFTLVCHETRRLANHHLRQHCIHLDSQRRLDCFLQCIPAQPSLKVVTSISLAPFGEQFEVVELYLSVRDLLSYTWQTLTKLVVDIPLRKLYLGDDDFSAHPVLLDGFRKPVNLEEFVSAQDDWCLNASEEGTCVWSQWQKLKRLALWNVWADEDFWRHVALHDALEVVVLPSTDDMMKVEPKAEYFKHGKRPIRVIISRSVVIGRQRPASSLFIRYANWEIDDPENNMGLFMHHYAADSDRFGDGDHQRYIKEAAEDGALWDYEYEEVIHPSQLDSDSFVHRRSPEDDFSGVLFDFQS